MAASVLGEGRGAHGARGMVGGAGELADEPVEGRLGRHGHAAAVTVLKDLRDPWHQRADGALGAAPLLAQHVFDCQAFEGTTNLDERRRQRVNGDQ